jgi:hypothetical protein
MVFLVLHPFNYPLALLLRLFGPVAYWKVEGLHASLLSPFEAIAPRDLTDSPSWNGLLQDAHGELARQIDGAPSIPVSFGGVTADLGQLWLHWFAHRFEANVLGQYLCVAWARRRGVPCRMVRDGTAHWALTANVRQAAIEGVRMSAGSVVADRLWELAKGARVVAGTLLRCLLAPARPDLHGRSFRYLFAGISPSPRGHEPGRIDFAFLVRRGLLPAKECVYVSGRPLSAAQEKALQATGAASLAYISVTALFSLPERIRLMLRMIGTIARALFTMRSGETLVAMLSRALPLYSAARRMNVEVLVVGLDDGLLEPPAMPLLAAAGVRTLMYQHALVGFAHANSGAPFLHRTIEQSALAADTFCVWSPADQAMLKGRALKVVPEIRITGPVMSGDARWLRCTKTDVLRAAGLDVGVGRKVITVFDLPYFDPDHVRTFRIAINRTSEAMQSAFFDDMAEILRRFPEVVIAFKPKRGQDPRFLAVDSARRLTDPEGEWVRSGRLHLFGFDVDPYLPVATADLCIGMPFTSPVAVSVNSGRPGFWYDPTGFVKRPYPEELEQLLIRGRESLMQHLDMWRSGGTFQVPACLLSGIDDPGAELARIVTALARPSAANAA